MEDSNSFPIYILSVLVCVEGGVELINRSFSMQKNKQKENGKTVFS
jgi:hypothetical protein